MRWLLVVAACTPSFANAVFLECHDKTLCATFDDCDATAALTRAGNLCRNYPWYNGGAPMQPPQWRTTTLSGLCFDRRADSKGPLGTCRSWLVTDGMLTMRCACAAGNATTCHSWTCSSDWSTVCTCDTAECSTWSCTDAGSSATDDGDGVPQVTVAKGICVQNTTNGAQCGKWSVADDNGLGFGVTSCWCLASASAACDRWRCLRKGLLYVAPSHGWIAFGIGVGCLAAVLCLALKEEGTVCLCGIVVVGTVVLVLYKGGFFAACVTCAAVVVLACIAARCARSRKVTAQTT